ncbi:UDP-N-acetylglucosamine--LPS N-acetylglucosamine transferase [Halostreptopolyspora alba]|uniref:UDP-N-acetylglucosamine--LPS N-acetylglucosamine transferase n=1 Tax=Halostreptopolyspora alba TaxID=2487137 RepID=A0A3N0E4T6_9ACTN|nr:UDP-N-acetylglucosamine--LPS N-acetylglucosamine transferase [Nocardiopsaceae bacterium YIM 96095]
MCSASPVLLVASAGEHLAQLWALRPWWERRTRVWVSYPTMGATPLLRGEEVHWVRPRSGVRGAALLRELSLATRMFARRRPAVVVSTGAGVALPFFVVAWLAGVPTVYIERYDRLGAPTLTARLCRPFTRLYLTQWEEQREFLPAAITVGPLL